VNISVYIERLILDGINIGPGQGALVKTAVEAELSRLLTKGGLATSLQSGGALPSVRAKSIQMSEDSTPSQLGQQIARSVYGGIGRNK
jgi:hypothetical protein